MTRAASGVIVLVLAQGMAGCGSSGTPSAPSPAAQPVPTYTLSGVVLGMTPTGLVPLEGVGVQINLVKPAFTGADGFYSIPGLTLTGLLPNTAIGNFNIVTAWKPGYVNDSKTVTISADTRLDVHLRQLPTFTLSGTVREMTDAGLVPIRGVQIDDWSCDPVFPGNRQRVPTDGCNAGISHSATSDMNGRYSIPGVYASRNLICATREGDPINTPESECGGHSATLMIDGDTQFDILLVRQ